MDQFLPAACRDLLDRQASVISRSQAIAAGAAPLTVRSLLRTGRWQPVHRGVYLAHPGEPGRSSLLWAALLRVGPDAVLSHLTAAELDRLVPPSPVARADDLARADDPAHPAARAPIHVSVPRDQHVGPITGVVLHRRADLGRYRHPAALPPRTRIEDTTLDLALGARTLDEAMAWLARACGSRLTTPARLGAALAARPRVRWRRELAGALADVAAGAHSALELRYLRDVERPHGLPRGERQVRTVRDGRSCYRDVLYREFRVAVETDGTVAHPPEVRWQDQERDNAAAVVEDIITLRYGWAAITQRPCSVATEVAQLLRRHGWTGRLRWCGPECTAGAARSAGAGRTA
jgi:Transcriptional regulator, AbiEi antitoxin